MTSADDLDALVKQAQARVRDGGIAEAIELFQKALPRDEDRADVHEGLATAYFLSRDYENAIKHFSRVTLLKPTSGKALINLGAVYNRMGRYEDAISALRRGIQREKKRGEGFYNLGLAYRGLGQLSMAASAYREALRLDPKMAESHLNLANVYVDMGNNRQAISHYTKALEIHPNFERAQRGLKAAEEAIRRAKQSISPFGRLVDEERAASDPKRQQRLRARAPATASGTGAPAVPRKLSDDERRDDRDTVYALALEIETVSKRVLVNLKQNFDHRLLALDRAVVHGGEATSALLKAHEDFQEAAAQLDELRHAMVRQIRQLRAHEDSMKDEG